MSIDDFLKKGVLVKQDTSKKEIEELLGIVERDLKDSANEGVSNDNQFGMAYNAGLKLATILVRGSGYRIKGMGHHMNTFAIIPLVLGEDKKDDSEYLDTCRKKRNMVEYDRAGGATEADVKELIEFVVEFKEIVLEWLKNEHKNLV